MTQWTATGSSSIKLVPTAFYKWRFNSLMPPPMTAKQVLLMNPHRHPHSNTGEPKPFVRLFFTFFFFTIFLFVNILLDRIDLFCKLLFGDIFLLVHFFIFLVFFVIVAFRQDSNKLEYAQNKCGIRLTLYFDFNFFLFFINFYFLMFFFLSFYFFEIYFLYRFDDNVESNYVWCFFEQYQYQCGKSGGVASCGYKPRENHGWCVVRERMGQVKH